MKHRAAVSDIQKACFFRIGYSSFRNFFGNGNVDSIPICESCVKRSAMIEGFQQVWTEMCRDMAPQPC